MADDDARPVVPSGSSSWVQEPSAGRSLEIELQGTISADRLTPEVMSALSDLMASVQAYGIEPDDACPTLSSCGQYDSGGSKCTRLKGCGVFRGAPLE